MMTSQNSCGFRRCHYVYSLLVNLHLVHLKNCVSGSSELLVCSVHQNAKPCPHLEQNAFPVCDGSINPPQSQNSIVPTYLNIVLKKLCYTHLNRNFIKSMNITFTQPIAGIQNTAFPCI